MTNNTEPLKVGEECREAFEQWMQETYGYVPEPNTVYREGTYLSERDDDRWIAYQAGRIQSTSPSPAEVGSERSAPCGDVLWRELMQWCKKNRTAPANHNDLFNIVQVIRDQEALNQRLAVKEGEAEPCCNEPSICGRACVFRGEWLERNDLDFPSPVSDDQQAKDAARPIDTAPEGKIVVVLWLDSEDAENPERYAFDYLEDGVWMNYFNEHEHYAIAGVARGNSEDAPYTHWWPLPALSTTKQEAAR